MTSDVVSSSWVKALEAFHMKCQHQILGIRWSDFVSNVDVQARTGLTPLGEILAAHRISVFGHTTQLESDVPAHMVLSKMLSFVMRSRYVACMSFREHH